MLFNSIHFLIFFFVFYLLYLKSNLKIQNYLLLIGGLFFYSFWNYKATFLLIFCILFNFYSGIFLEKKDKNKFFFSISIIVNLSILVFFKYIIFLSNSLNDFFVFSSIDFKIKLLDIILPVGISFYTFHNISYLSDVYTRKISASKNLLSFFIYDLFFPLLLSGPIERAEKLIPQIERKRNIEKENFVSGLILFCIGILKKVFISDNLSSFVNLALDPKIEIPPGLSYYIAFSFALQVYTDFSGYTDAARGLARMMGFELSLNFNLPFTSKNPSEFWTRWHISLSSWLRDYIYIPLGGNKFGFLRQNKNLMIVWILGGLWHGATYGYFIWGIYCGAQVVLYNLLNRFLPVSKNEVSLFDIYVMNNLFRILTFFLFGFGLLLFRVENYSHLERILLNSTSLYFNASFIMKILFLISPLVILEGIQIYKKDLEAFHFSKIHPMIFYTLTSIFVIQFLLFSSFEAKEFFYFQF